MTNENRREGFGGGDRGRAEKSYCPRRREERPRDSGYGRRKHSDNKGFSRDGRGDNRGARFSGAREGQVRRRAEITDARNIAFEVLFKFFVKSEPIETTIDRLFDKKDFATKEPIVASTEKRLAYEIIYGVLRNKSRLDYVLDKYLPESVRCNDAVKTILQIGAYQIIYLSKIPEFAAVNESVNMAKRHSQTAKFSDLVNAVLRKLIAEKKLSRAKNFPEIDIKDFAEKIAVEYSHPLWLVQKWIEQFGKTPTQKLLQFNNSIPEIFARRISTLTNKNKFEATIAKSCNNGVARGVGFNSLYYKIKPGERIERSDLFQSGQCTIQAPSSGWVVALLDVKDGAKILDLCAAPGGKTTLLSELAPSSQIVATDISFMRAKMISQTLKRLSIRNVDLVVSDARSFGVSEKFDYVLIDAPCSATGVINHHPESRWIRNEEAMQRAVSRQKEILYNAKNLVEVGGVIVYSTCSLEKEENRDVVEEFLSQNADFELVPAKEHITDSQILSENGSFLEITPSKNNADAIFAAKFRRIS